MRGKQCGQASRCCAQTAILMQSDQLRCYNADGGRQLTVYFLPFSKQIDPPSGKRLLHICCLNWLLEYTLKCIRTSENSIVRSVAQASSQPNYRIRYGSAPSSFLICPFPRDPSQGLGYCVHRKTRCYAKADARPQLLQAQLGIASEIPGIGVEGLQEGHANDKMSARPKYARELAHDLVYSRRML